MSRSARALGCTGGAQKVNATAATRQAPAKARNAGTYVCSRSKVIAAICGAIGRAIAGGARGGVVVSTALGFIGALLGPWLAARLKLPEPLVIMISGHPFPVLWSIIGAALFVAIIHLVSRR